MSGFFYTSLEGLDLTFGFSWHNFTGCNVWGFKRHWHPVPKERIMKKLPVIIVIILILLMNPLFICGQEVTADVDTIAFFVPNMHKQSFRFLTDVANISEFYQWGGNLYQFSDSTDKEIQYSDIRSTFFQNKPDQTLRDMASGAATLITGIGFGSTVDGHFEVSGKVTCNDSLPEWNVLMFCEGSRETERERVRDEDGVTGVSTNETYIYNWDRNAAGILVEGNDTIGYFRIIMNPREDSLLKSFSAGLLPPRKVSKVTVTSNYSAKTAAEVDFGISGTFCGNDFFVISDGTDRKTWIFINNELISMFQEYRSLSRKSQILPYLIVNKNVPGPDRRDLVRIAIMSRCLNTVLN